ICDVVLSKGSKRESFVIRIVFHQQDGIACHFLASLRTSISDSPPLRLPGLCDGTGHRGRVAIAPGFGSLAWQRQHIREQREKERRALVDRALGPYTTTVPGYRPLH